MDRMGLLDALFRLFQKQSPPKPPEQAVVAKPVAMPKSHLSAQVHNAECPIVEALDGQLKVAAIRASERADRAFTNRVREKLKRGLELRTMPQAMLTIQRLLAAPDCDITTLADALKREPTLAARIVSLANCALYGGQSRVRTVEHAIVRIGLRETRNITMAIACRTKLFKVPGGKKEADALYWHALASAVTGRLIARAIPSQAIRDTGNAFIACMLADLGRIVVLSEAADLRRESRGAQTPTQTFLTELADDAHATISALIAESWGYDESITGAILHHHAPQESHLFSYVIFASDRIAERILLSHAPGGAQVLDRALSKLGLSGRQEALFHDAQRAYSEFAHVVDGYEGPKQASQIRGKLMSI